MVMNQCEGGLFCSAPCPALVRLIAEQGPHSRAANEGGEMGTKSPAIPIQGEICISKCLLEMGAMPNSREKGDALEYKGGHTIIFFCL